MPTFGWSLPTRILSRAKNFFIMSSQWWSYPVCILEMLNPILTECFMQYRPKHCIQHFVQILLDISKYRYKPAIFTVAHDVKWFFSADLHLEPWKIIPFDNSVYKNLG